jgi:SAM-dependent methyltransferase
MTEVNGEAPWYARYFGADYLRIYRLADTEEQLALLRRVLAPWQGGRLLDLPCGHGRHAVTLASEGWRVCGLDLNPTFLTVARLEAARRGVSLPLARADMRRVPLADAGFDALICMFTSLGYFDSDEEHQGVLLEFARLLRPGGGFVLDLANVDAVRRQPPEAHWMKEGVEVHSTYLWDEATHRAETRRDVSFPDGRREHYASSVRLFESAELAAMLAVAGFTVLERYGSYAGEPLAEDRPRRIVVARRD